jgi:hypothetical protein
LSVPTVRTGIVGAGFMGRLHGRLLAELPDAEASLTNGGTVVPLSVIEQPEEVERSEGGQNP